MSDSHRAPGGASPFAQGVVGAAACGIAAIPLAVVLTLIAGIFGDTGGLGEIVLGFALYAVFGSFIALAMGFLVGLPLYLLLNRVGALRLDVFMLLGAAGGFAVFAFVDRRWTRARRLAICTGLCHVWRIQLLGFLAGC